MTDHSNVAVIGAGPAGAAAAITAARGGAGVVMFEKGAAGRDKVCGDGLTPRAVAALDELGIAVDSAHRIDGLRMIAGRIRRELSWPANGRFGAHGAVWPRRELDKRLVEAAEAAGTEIIWETEARPIIESNGAVTGVEAAGRRWTTDLVVVATGAPGAVARMLGTGRDASEPFGLAIRTYAPTPRHDDRYLEACLTLQDDRATPVPGYGWIFPAGDGTVNIGVGALSTMQGFDRLNLNRLLGAYRSQVHHEWELGENLERPRAWRLPMSAIRRHGPGWVAVGDAAGLINPMNGEGIDYGLESGMLAATLLLTDPATAPDAYDRAVSRHFDRFLRTGRRFSFLIGRPWILRNGVRLAVGSRTVADITLQVMGNLINDDSPGTAGRVLRLADRALAAADRPLRRRSARKPTISATGTDRL